MKILKQTCIAGEIRVYETHIIKVQVKKGVAISFKVKTMDDLIDTAVPENNKEWLKYSTLTLRQKDKIGSLIEKALGKTL